MKKIILTFCFLLIAQIFTKFPSNSPAFADEVVDSKGIIIPCRIETVEEGFVEYKKDGNLYTFTRDENSPIFNDYIDVRQKLFKKDSVERYSGKIVVKDMWSTIIRNENGDIDIPFYRVKFVGVYKP